MKFRPHHLPAAGIFLLGLLALLAGPSLFGYTVFRPAVAQTYPSASTYIPTVTVPALTRTTTGNVASFTLNGQGIYSFRLGGTFATLAASVQVSNDASSVADGSATWTTTDLFPVPGSSGAVTQSVTAAGLYRVNVNGMTRVRIVVATLTGGNLVIEQAATPGPFIRTPSNADVGALLSGQLLAGTTNSSDVINYDGGGVVCRFVATTSSGSPSAVFNIQSYDAATASYRTMLSSAAITTPTGESTMMVYPGIQTSSLPSNWASISLKMPRVWRLQAVVTGATTAITGIAGCQNLSP